LRNRAEHHVRRRQQCHAWQYGARREQATTDRWTPMSHRLVCRPPAARHDPIIVAGGGWAPSRGAGAKALLEITNGCSEVAFENVTPGRRLMGPPRPGRMGRMGCARTLAALRGSRASPLHCGTGLLLRGPGSALSDARCYPRRRVPVSSHNLGGVSEPGLRLACGPGSSCQVRCGGRTPGPLQGAGPRSLGWRPGQCLVGPRGG
jgi:hypothetical protein